MSSLNVNDIVRLHWSYGYDHGYGFAIVKSKTPKTATAYLIETNEISSVFSDPIHWTTVITAGKETHNSITLLNSGSSKFPKELRKELDMTKKSPSWALWDGQPITQHHACD
jgi:hypothetical protein